MRITERLKKLAGLIPIKEQNATDADATFVADDPVPTTPDWLQEGCTWMNNNPGSSGANIDGTVQGVLWYPGYEGDNYPYVNPQTQNQHQFCRDEMILSPLGPETPEIEEIMNWVMEQIWEGNLDYDTDFRNVWWKYQNDNGYIQVNWSSTISGLEGGANAYSLSDIPLGPCLDEEGMGYRHYNNIDLVLGGSDSPANTW